MRKILGVILITLFILGSLATVFIVNNMLPYAGIMPRRIIATESPALFDGKILPKHYGLSSKIIWLKTSDNLLLKGYFIQTNEAIAKATIIILHGIADCKESQLGRAKVLADSGYNAVVLDLRAHGESEGKYCTFGYYEKEDIKLLVDEILIINNRIPVGIWGSSLGGAIALQAMSIDKRINFGIIEGTFDDFHKVAVEYGADYLFGIKSKWLTNVVLAKSGKIAKFNPHAVKPVVAATQITNPVLFIHGDADGKIPITFNKNNFNATNSRDKAWITVKGAGHNNVGKIGGENLKDQIMKFIYKQLK